MMKKFLQEKGQVLHRFTYENLVKEKWEREEHKNKGILIMESIYQKLHPQAIVDDLVELSTDGTLQYYPNEDKTQNVENFPAWEEKPNWVNKYLNAEPPKGGKLSGTSETWCWW